MSTPKWKKEQRQRELKAAARQRKIEKDLYSSKPVKTKEFREYVPTSTYRRETPDYPSVTTSGCANATGKRESQQYTGDYITGIAVMHKSNLVPVSRGVDPKDYSTMRRN